MSKICLEFLYNSFLYHLDLCEAQYRGFSDKDLESSIFPGIPVCFSIKNGV